MNKKTLIFLCLIIGLAFFLRFFKLEQFPPGLYSDEASLGYNAYSILKTGKDEFGKFLPLTFRSFGDYKPPLSAYIMIPFIWLFGLNEVSIRLPFVIAGILSVVAIFFLCLELFEQNKHKFTIAFISAILLAISPWHIGQTRSAMLVGLEVFFNLLGVLFFLKGLRKNIFLVFSSISFSLAVYAYYGSRITAPLIIICLLAFFGRKFLEVKKNIFVFLIGFAVLIPLFLAIIRDPETLLGRAKYMSIFYDKNVAGQLWETTVFDAGKIPTVLSRIFHNKPYYYGKDVFKRWLQHFNIGFLFFQGDSVAPFHLPNMGLLYLIDLPFLILGLKELILKKEKNSTFIILWLIVSPVVSAFTFMTPASNRSFNMIFPLIIITGYGIVSFIGQKRSKTWIGILLAGYAVCFGYYIYQYTWATPHQIPKMWHYGRKELVSDIVKYQGNYQKVVLSDTSGPPYIFLLFFQKYDPQKYWQTGKLNLVVTDLGWEHIDSFANYEFIRDFNWKIVKKEYDVLYVGDEDEVPDNWVGEVAGKTSRIKILDKILYPSGKTDFKLFELTKV